MNIEHTPGPWRIEDAGPNSGNIIRMEIMWGDYKICEIEDSSIDAKQKGRAARQDEANARLIAAAPELLLAGVDAHEAIFEACLFLHNGTPVQNGSDVHADLVAARDKLAAVLVKAGYGIK